ncbi:aryl-alcohol dehydrogenase-like predicted oxidoreductase [Salana multivorans]|uniref:Aryl-alcohol dehydrogenase-like predicted oxidoreductase n=1 Tax=Salana multivorans TaxID=120377 RepID=A0A3N2D829_9MICO|nr:aldo/keto reductase [Salana multivorans]ROR95939.1 aryl-alcohol dehydrogenase-like predicted oxidoreductase [Salana multivorans]
MTHVPTATDPTATPAAPLGDLGRLVLGGNVFGWTADRAASFAVLDAFVAAGGRAIDTADAYSSWVPGHVGGESESIIGEWLAANGARDEVVLCTKVAKHPDLRGLAPSVVERALTASLRRLRTDSIDLYYAHEDDPALDPDVIAATLAGTVIDGRVRALGLSNFPADRLRAVVGAAHDAGLPAPAYSQDRYSLVERGLETTLVPTLLDLGVVELPFHSLAAGFLTGKYRLGAEDADSPRSATAAGYLARPGAHRLLAVLDGIAADAGVPVAAVALAWLREQPGVGAPIASARSVEQLEALTASFALVLGERELADLTAASDALDG